MNDEARNVEDSGPAIGASATVIAAGATVRGEVRVDGDVIVRGRIEGDVACTGALFVDVDGVVHADLTAGSVRVGGEVEGDVAAHDLVELVGGGRITGEIFAARVSIADGATLRGTVTLRAPGAAVADGFDVDAPATAPATPSSTSTGGDPAAPRDADSRRGASGRAPYIDASGRPPPTPGLIEKTVKPRVFLRRASETGRPRTI